MSTKLDEATEEVGSALLNMAKIAVDEAARRAAQDSRHNLRKDMKKGFESIKAEIRRANPHTSRVPPRGPRARPAAPLS